MISNTVISLDLENCQQLSIFDGCSPDIVFFVALPGAQLVLNDLYTYIIFFILQNLKKFPKNWMTRRNVCLKASVPTFHTIICSWYFFISSVKHIPQNNWKHRSTTQSISLVATNRSVFNLFEQIVYLALIINSDVKSSKPCTTSSGGKKARAHNILRCNQNFWSSLYRCCNLKCCIRFHTFE